MTHGWNKGFELTNSATKTWQAFEGWFFTRAVRFFENFYTGTCWAKTARKNADIDLQAQEQFIKEASYGFFMTNAKTPRNKHNAETCDKINNILTWASAELNVWVTEDVDAQEQLFAIRHQIAEEMYGKLDPYKKAKRAYEISENVIWNLGDRPCRKCKVEGSKGKSVYN